MCMQCYNEYGSPKIINKKTKKSAKMIDKIYENVSVTGGDCHIVIDDWNLEDSHIKSCINSVKTGETWESLNKEQKNIEMEFLTKFKELSIEERASAMAIHEGFIPEKIIKNGYEIDRRMPTFKKQLRESVIDGTKTQTRRIMKPQPPEGTEKIEVLDDGTYFRDTKSGDRFHVLKKCPYGKPGEVQVLREPLKRHIYHPDKENIITDTILYADDGVPVIWGQACNGLKKENLSYNWKWQNDKLPAMFMPTEMGRYFYRINNIWAQRIQNISFDDCLAEGVVHTDFWPNCDDLTTEELEMAADKYEDPTDYIDEGWEVYTKNAMRRLWDSINTEDGKTWDDNPWVWAIEFEKIEKVKVRRKK